jgi:glucan phosphoethanolaminetransferase (alkaline phosphatase superfamily)
MSQAVKRSSPTFIWWATYIAVFIPLLFFLVVRETINPVLDGWGDWVKAVCIALFLSVIINAPTANIATSCIRHPKDTKHAAKWSALVVCGFSLVLWLIVAGLHLFWLSVLYALVTGITVGITVHHIARKI